MAGNRKWWVDEMMIIIWYCHTMSVCMDLFFFLSVSGFFSLMDSPPDPARLYVWTPLWDFRPQTPSQTKFLDPPQQPKSSDFYEILYTTVHLELDASRMTIYEHIQNSRWRTAVILKVIFFDLNWAVDIVISFKFCIWKQAWYMAIEVTWQILNFENSKWPLAAILIMVKLQ